MLLVPSNTKLHLRGIDDEIQDVAKKILSDEAKDKLRAQLKAACGDAVKTAGLWGLVGMFAVAGITALTVGSILRKR